MSNLTYYRGTEYARAIDQLAHERLRVRVLMFLGGRCEVCGWNDMRALCLDHVNGDGKADRKKHKNVRALLRNVFREPHRYQVLCENHNKVKALEVGELQYRSLARQRMLAGKP